MNQENYTVLDIDVNDLPFNDFLTSRYSMTVRVNAQKTYGYCREHHLSFFNITLACMLRALNDIPEFRRRIVEDKVYEYESVSAITPILQEDNLIREMEIELSGYGTLSQYDTSVESKKRDIDNNEFLVEASLRDTLPICNLSCIPWIDFDSMTNIIASANQIMPVVTWGKLVNGKIPVSLTASHIFIFGYHFHLFYDNLEKYLENPNLLFSR